MVEERILAVGRYCCCLYHHNAVCNWILGLALLEFRAGVSRDPYGAFGTWNPDDHDPCSWSNVHCVDGNVQVLDLDGLSLEGVLAPEIGSLTHLRRLAIIALVPFYLILTITLPFDASVLSHNQFAGAIPKELGELTMLEVLDLRDNNLSGHIPSELGRMHSLKRLLLCNNNLEGSIPMELRTLNFLYEMQYDENLLSIVADGIAEPEMVHNVKQDANVVRRKLAEESPNLAAAPSPNDGFGPPKIIALPSSRSSGSFPAVPKDKKAHAINQPPSYGLVQGSPEESSSTSSQPPTNDQPPQSRMNSYKCRILIAISCIVLLLIIGIALCFVCRTRAVKTIGPWRSGISGQLQKAFVTGVPKLNRTELETACEDFSNIIEAKESYTLYKGTLSSGVEICVASTTIASLKDWSKRAELGMMVFEYAPNGSLSEHLHGDNLGFLLNPTTYILLDDIELVFFVTVEELEHLDWSLRMRIIMGTAYCLEYMHELNPPIPHTNLNATLIRLTDDYAPKHSELDGICEVIEECIQQDARKRPTMKEVVTKLREVLAISPEQAIPRLSPLWWAELEILSGEAA
ncbi:Leucine-rich repeat-containing protein [Cynara cardunculus var. scolymus]|uniref:Leucine-rich repeat-containing protein n=1 Tax=Cynara cardunculus var. scolymus TaxID=59895 RepID=A0A118K0D6_CYNCS|nr:Leucine-rich repeat-containing protein [Cynara cardunculus var. scolymus]